METVVAKHSTTVSPDLSVQRLVATKVIRVNGGLTKEEVFVGPFKDYTIVHTKE